MVEYSVGLILVLLFVKTLGWKFEGIWALIMLTVVSYGIGKFVLDIIHGEICGR